MSHWIKSDCTINKILEVAYWFLVILSKLLQQLLAFFDERGYIFVGHFLSFAKSRKHYSDYNSIHDQNAIRIINAF